MTKLNSILIIPPTQTLDFLNSPKHPNFALPILNTSLVMVNINYLQVFSEKIYILVVKEFLNALIDITQEVPNIHYLPVDGYDGIHHAIHANLDKLEGDKFFIHKNNTILNIDIKCFDLNFDVYCLLRNLYVEPEFNKKDAELSNEKREKERKKCVEKAQSLAKVYFGYRDNKLVYLKRKNIRAIDPSIIRGNVKFNSCSDILSSFICSRRVFDRVVNGKSFRYDFLADVVDEFDVSFGWVDDFECFKVESFDSYVQANVFYKCFYDFPQVTNTINNSIINAGPHSTHKENNMELIEKVNSCNTPEKKEINRFYISENDEPNTSTKNIISHKINHIVNTQDNTNKNQNSGNIYGIKTSVTVTSNTSAKSVDLSSYIFGNECIKIRELLNKISKDIGYLQKEYNHHFDRMCSFKSTKIKRVTFVNKPDLKKTVVGCNIDINDNELISSIIGDNVHVGINSKIISSFLMNNVSVGDHCNIDGSIIGSEARIGNYVELFMCIVKPGTVIDYGTYRNKNIG